MGLYEQKENETEGPMILQLMGSMFRVSTPLVFASLGGMMSERSGVINIALEGFMLVGAFAGAVGAYRFENPWIGMLCGAGAGLMLSIVYAFAVIRLRSDQIVAGTAINFLAMGVVPFLNEIFYNSTGNTPAIPVDGRFGYQPVYMAWLLVIGIWFWMKSSASGLWLQFAGEHPQGLDAAGVSVNRVRWIAVMCSGILAGLGGVTLSVFLASAYSRNMTAGRGFMALAALIVGKWKPIPAAITCLLFGFAEAIQIRLQGVVLWGTEPVPVQFIQILPYIMTTLILAGFVGQSRSPKNLGIPFEKAG